MPHATAYNGANKSYRQIVLRRKKVFELLDNGLQNSAVWILGPAGSGKTTLIRTYLDERKTLHVYMDIHSLDTEPMRFCDHLTGLITNSGLAYNPQSVEGINACDEVTDIAVNGRQFFSRIFRQLKEPVVFVFDNLNMLDDKSPSFVLLRSAFEVLPAHIKIIFSSRHRPNKYFVRYFVSGQLEVIGQQDLQFSLDDIRKLISKLDKKSLGKSSPQIIYEKTGGWAVGVHMWLQSVLDDAMDSCPTHDFVPRVIFNYIEGEIFDPLPLVDQESLLMASILPSITPGRLEVMLGDCHTGEIISHLLLNRFTAPDSKTDSYAFNPLFHEFLFQKAKGMLDNSRFRNAVVSVIGHLLEKMQFEDAVDIYRKIGRTEAIKEALQYYIRRQLLEGNCSPVEKLLSALPESFRRDEPWAQLAAVVCHPDPDPNLQRRRFERIDSIFQKTGDADAWLVIIDGLVELAATATPLPPTELDNLIERLHSAEWTTPHMRTEKIRLRIADKALVLLALRRPDHPFFEALDHWAAEKVRKSRSDEIKGCLARALAWKNLLLGDLLTAKHFYDISNDVPEPAAHRPHWKVETDCWLSIYCFLTGDFEKGYDIADNASNTALTAGSDDLSFLPLSCKIACDFLSTNHQRRKTHLSDLARIKDDCRKEYGYIYHALAFWDALVEDNIASASAHAENALRLATASDSQLLSAWGRLLSALVSYHSGELKDAENKIDLALDYGLHAGIQPLKYVCYLAYALVGSRGKASSQKWLNHIKKGMRMAKRLGYANAWMRGNETMVRLCKNAIENGIEIEHSQTMVRLTCSHREFPNQAVWPVRIYSLGRFAVIINGTPVDFSSRVTTPINLLKAMLAMGYKRQIPTKELQTVLWPEAKATEASKSLKINLHRLRKILGYHEAVLVSESRTWLNPNLCRVDLWELEDLIAEISDSREDRLIKLTNKLIEKCMMGHIMPEIDFNWSIAYREQLKKRCLNCMKRLADFYVKDHKLMQAVHIYNKAMLFFPDNSNIYYQLISIYSNAGLRTMAISTYALYKNMVKAKIIGNGPSEAMQSLFKKVLCIS